jgi:hypothetical protein
VLERALTELVAAGIAEARSNTWRLAEGGDAAAIAELVAAWSADRAAVLSVMTERSLERIRASAARRFADAFKFRHRDGSGGGRDDG